MKQHSSVSSLISEVLLLLFAFMQFLFMVCLLYTTLEGKVLLFDCCTAELLFEYCLILYFAPFPIALRRTMYDSKRSHTEGLSKPKVLRENKMRIRETGVWVDRQRDKGRQCPVRHREFWCYCEIRCMFI